jgi:ethanolamine utilization protein EutA
MASIHRVALRRAHEGDEEHFHEWSEEQRNAAAQAIWQAENVELTTVGIDIGSSTSHLMFSRVHLQRKTQLLSSEFVVVSREVLWRSPILLTPFLPDFTIDAERLRRFIESAYEEAGVAPAAVDSGALILTGEAIKRRNAQAIAGIFASQAGKFVCASAGHHMECALAAHGSGAAAISRHTHKTVLNIDIGGGTTKFALIRNGEIRGSCALAVGGRLVVQDIDGRLTRVEGPARQAARTLGIDLRLGERFSDGERDRLAHALAEAVIAMILGSEPQGLAKELLLTAPLDLGARPQLVTFSGGVSEYIFGREASTFGDLAKPLAERIAGAFSGGRIGVPMMDPGQGIRATVIGASQFTVQLSGKTIHLSDGVELPVRNVPVTFPALGLERHFDAASVAVAIAEALARIDADRAQPIALGIRWHGEPHYRRLRELAAGIAQALGGDAPAPLILMVDRDVAGLLGHILEHELRMTRGIISIDGIQLRELDYVDIGEMIQPSNVVPVVIKSLLFSMH